MTTMTPGAVRLRLKEIRKKMGLTQIELAEKTGLHEQTISRLEGDPRQIEFDTIEKICKALNISVDDLIEVSQ